MQIGAWTNMLLFAFAAFGRLSLSGRGGARRARVCLVLERDRAVSSSVVAAAAAAACGWIGSDRNHMGSESESDASVGWILGIAARYVSTCRP